MHCLYLYISLFSTCFKNLFTSFSKFLLFSKIFLYLGEVFFKDYYIFNSTHLISVNDCSIHFVNIYFSPFLMYHRAFTMFQSTLFWNWCMTFTFVFFVQLQSFNLYIQIVLRIYWYSCSLFWTDSSEILPKSTGILITFRLGFSFYRLTYVPSISD